MPNIHRGNLLKTPSGKCILFDNQQKLGLVQKRTGGQIVTGLPLFYGSYRDNYLECKLLYRPVVDYHGTTAEYAAFTEELIGQEQQLRHLVCRMMPFQIRKSFKSETWYALPRDRIPDTLLVKPVKLALGADVAR